MRALVMDGSTALAFLMPDEQSPEALRAIEALERGVPTWVPSHWALEVANGMLMAERRRRISRADATEVLDVLGRLPIETDGETGRRAAGETAGLARQYGLTVYDAAYSSWRCAVARRLRQLTPHSRKPRGKPASQ